MKRTLQIFIFAVLVQACGQKGSPTGMTESGQIRRTELPVKYKIASTIPESYRSEIREAFEEWNRAAGSEVFVYDGVKNLKADQLAPDYTFNENVVLMTNDSGSPKDADGHPIGASPLARTFVYGASKIMDTDIYLYEFEDNFVRGRDGTGDVYSLKSVIMHEAGHMVFGDWHSSEEDSIMTPVLYPMNDPREKSHVADCDVERLVSSYADIL